MRARTLASLRVEARIGGKTQTGWRNSASTKVTAWCERKPVVRLRAETVGVVHQRRLEARIEAPAFAHWRPQPAKAQSSPGWYPR
jgi:hypothetical protein